MAISHSLTHLHTDTKVQFHKNTHTHTHVRDVFKPKLWDVLKKQTRKQLCLPNTTPSPPNTITLTVAPPPERIIRVTCIVLTTTVLHLIQTRNLGYGRQAC